MIETIEFHSSKKGVQVLFFGAVHGNEKCGTTALRNVAKKIESGKLKLLKGSAVFVPVANPRAYAANARYVDANLNRIFIRSKNPKKYEAKLVNELAPLIDACDVLLDIHSITAKGKPFFYMDKPTKRNVAWGNVLGPTLAIVGWPLLYKKIGKSGESQGTQDYAIAKGKDALLIECGQHTEAAAVHVAEKAILNTLAHYGLLKGTPKSMHPARIAVEKVHFRDSASSGYAKEWKHLEKVKKNTVLAMVGEGKKITAPYDGYVIMPNKNAKVGEDWFYFGKERA